MSDWQRRRNEASEDGCYGVYDGGSGYDEPNAFREGWDEGRKDAETEFIAAGRLAKLDAALIAKVKAETELSDLKTKLAIAIEALEKVNKEELNSQRPGGGHSKSATISYEALNKIRGMK